MGRTTIYEADLALAAIAADTLAAMVGESIEPDMPKTCAANSGVVAFPTILSTTASL